MRKLVADAAAAWRVMEESKELFDVMAWSMIAAGGLAFFFLAVVQVNAPYGRYSASASPWWGPGLNAQWAWCIQELPCFLFAVHALYTKASAELSQQSSVAGWVLLALFTLHYTNRALVYPWQIKAGSETRLTPFLMATAFCSYNGYMQCRYLVLFDDFPADAHASPRFVLGVTLFLVGMAINLHADSVLRSLRTPANPEYKPGVRYYIPRGGAFEFVTGANFFGEILEWAGFALASGSLVALAFAAFTFCNIAPRGAAHHRNMQSKFEDYPKYRKGVIPFLW